MILEQVVFQFRELRYCDFDGRRKNGYSFRCILNVFIQVKARVPTIRTDKDVGSLAAIDERIAQWSGTDSDGCNRPHTMISSDQDGLTTDHGSIRASLLLILCGKRGW
jgi:hypothetical protein